MAALDTGGLETAGEAGAMDNRVSININDERFAGLGMDKWEDGQDYDVSLRINQVSPGEFEIVSAKGGAAKPEEEDEAEGVTAAEKRTPGSTGRAPEQYENPAVANLM